MLKQRLKWMLFPGINLHARLRWSLFRDLLGVAPPGRDRRVLDAGCGNGMLSYRSWQRGNTVLGVSIKPSEIEGCRALFNRHLGIDASRLSFEEANLSSIPDRRQPFDEIICCEVLEHLTDDASILRGLCSTLVEGGVLQVTVPNRDHPDNRDFPLDVTGRGGHVRSGYRVDELTSLLANAGVQSVESRGVGGSSRQRWNRRIIATQVRYGPVSGFPIFLLAEIFMASHEVPGDVPYSWYMKAVKRG